MLESVAARVCREVGATNVFVRDLDIAMVNTTDSRRLEVVVDGLPLLEFNLTVSVLSGECAT